MDSKERLLCLIGETIKTARLAQKISAEALAKSVHISRATLWSIEKGSDKASLGTYLDLAQILGLTFNINGNQKTCIENKRSPKRITKEKIKRNRFEAFCIEKYAQHTSIPSNNVYAIFKEENLLQMLRSDYEDLHGMGTEFLMVFFDSYLDNKQAIHKCETSKEKMSDHSTVKALIIPQILKLISDEYKISLDEAMNLFYTSKTCAALSDDDTDLFSQSPLFIFNLFKTCG